MPEPWEEYTATQEVSPWEEFGQTAVAEPPAPSDLTRRLKEKQAFKEEQAIGEAAESKANRLASAESALKLIAPSAENPLGPIGGVFRSAQATGKMLGAAVTDIADLPSEIASNQLLRNLRAWWNQKPEPIPGRLGLTGQVAKGIAETAPVVAEQMMLTAAGIPAPVAGGIAFGGAAEAAGAPPAEIAKQTAFGAVLGPAQQWSKEATGKVLKETIARLPVPIPETALKAAEFTGSQTAVNALFAGMESPAYVEAYKRDPKEAKDMLVQQVAMNLAFGVHDALGIRNPNVRSETIKAVYGDLRKMLDDLEVQKPISEKTPEQTQKDIEQAAKTLTERPTDAISKREATPVPVVETPRDSGAVVEEVRQPETPSDVQAQQAKAGEQPAPTPREGALNIEQVATELEPSGIKVRPLSIMGQKRWVVDYPTPPTPKGTTVGTMHVPEGTSVEGIKAEIAKRVPGFEEAKPPEVPSATQEFLAKAKARAEQVARSAVPQLSPEVVKAVQALPPVAKGYVRWWHGRKGTGGGGLGDVYNAKALPEDPLAGVRKALQYGPELSYTDVPIDVSERFEAGRRRGEATITDKEWAAKAKEVGTFEQPAFELEAPKEAETTQKSYDVYAQTTLGGGEQVRVAVDKNGNVVGGVGRIGYAGPESTDLYGVNLIGKNIKDLSGFKKQKYSVDQSELPEWKPETTPEPTPVTEPAKTEAIPEKILPESASIAQYEETYGNSVRDKILNAPSFPKLLAAAKSFQKSLGKVLRDDWEEWIKSTPWDLLSEHAGVMNAKSARAKTLRSLADAVIRESGLPMEKPGMYRGQQYRIDWKQVQKEQSQPEPMRVGPGAMTAGEIESRARVQGDRAAAGEIPPGNNPPVTTDGSLTPNIEVSRANRDMNILNNLNTAQWTFWMGRLGQAAKSAIERIFLGEFRMRESINRDVTSYVDATISSLPRPLRAKGGQAFFDVLDGKTMDQITAEWQGKKGGEAVIAGAQKVKGRLEEIRATIRDTKRDSFRGYLNSADKPFVEDLFKKNIDPNIDTSTMTKAQMADALTLNEFPDAWGIADGTYLPHLFMGNYKVTADIPGLGFVTRAKTLAEAKARIYELVKNNPDYASANFVIQQDTVVPADMIRLGDRQFWTFVGKMKDALQTTPTEIRQAQQGIIGRKAAKQKWFGSLQQRLGFGGYERNFKRVMGAYLNGFHRWKELSSMQRDVQPMIDQVKKEGRFQAAEGLNDIMEALWGKPARSTLQFDNFVRNIPGARDWIKPLALDRWSRNARSIISNLTLRTLRFATINRLQPLQGLYPLVGEKILIQGKKLQHTTEGRALLDEAGIRLDPGQYAEAGRMTKFGALMQRFSGEQSNQEWAFLSMYLHGTQQGMGRAQAIEYGKLRGQLMTQFTPLVSDIPPALRGPGGQLLFQFKRFPIKQVELVGSMIKDKNAPGIARMLGVFAVMGGASFFARQFFLDKEKQLRFKRMVDKQVGKGAGDVVMYGLPGYVGADISGSLVLGDEPFGANIYEKAGRALAGPTLSIGLETARRISTAARKPVSTLNKAEAIMRSIPSLKPIAELIRLESGNVDVLSPDGETKYRRQISDAIVGLGAFRSANEANKQLAVNAIIELKKETARLKNAYFVSKGGESEKKAIKDFNARWPEIAILPSELSRYVTYRRGEFGKTEEQKVAGKKYRRILAR